PAAAGFGRGWMGEERALDVAGNDEARRHVEVAARLLLGPERGALGELLQPERVVAALRVASHAAHVIAALLQEYRLDLRLEHLVIERLRPRGCGRNEQA